MFLTQPCKPSMIDTKKTFAFGIALGDACNSTQCHELRWYIDVIDKKEVNQRISPHAGTNTRYFF